MMMEDAATSKHNKAWCDCGLEWSGPQAHIEAAFHEQTTGHPIVVSALVKCHEVGCCDE